MIFIDKILNNLIECLLDNFNYIYKNLLIFIKNVFKEAF